MPQSFEYGTVEIAHLQARDPTLGEAIARIGWIERAMQPELFLALVHSLVSQQISNAAAATVWRRLIGQVGDLTPTRLAQTPLADLRACGVSLRKAEWLHGLSERVRSGALDLAALPALPDAEIIRLLSALPGVGVWTAEMLLIFALGRLDAGLFFLAYQRDPRTSFIPVQTRLARHDALSEYLQHVGSGVYAVPAGIAAGEHIGQRLFEA